MPAQLLPAAPGTVMIMELNGDYFLGPTVIAWLSEGEGSNLKIAPVSTHGTVNFEAHNGYLFPDGSVELGFGYTYRSLEDAEIKLRDN
jgi:hypothetical protein